MKSTIELMSQVKEALELMESNHAKLKKQEQEIHNEFLKAYHQIETMTSKFNMYQAWIILRDFQKLLQKRRIIKHELKHLEYNKGRIEHMKNSIENAFSKVSVSENGNVTYRENFEVTHDDIAI